MIIWLCANSFDCLEHLCAAFNVTIIIIIIIGRKLRITLEDGQLAGMGGEKCLGRSRKHTRGIHVNDEKQLYISILCFDVEQKKDDSGEIQNSL
jgi:hypothetical protein